MLVITIIVMIILASAIILSLSSSGIIGKANKAVKDTDKANLLEAANLAEAEYELKVNTGESVTGTKEEYVKSKLLSEGFTNDDLTSLSVLNDGTIQIIPKIPDGFVMSSYEGEQKVSDGMVIYKTESLNGVTQAIAQTTYDQYVWVPVEGTFERIAWENENLTTSYVEPIRAGINYVENITIYEGEIAQYNAMKASVEKYGGFYVGRYETGRISETVDGLSVSKAVCRRGQNVWNNYPWFNKVADGTYGVDTQIGVANAAKAEYEDSVRHLMYGVEWDATMNFMKDVPNPNVEGAKYIYNSTGMGEYDSYQGANAYTTGLSDNYKVKNIYDMAGNVSEFTYEVFTANSDGPKRVLRGGNNYGSYVEPASARKYAGPTTVSPCWGFRMSLYLE